jgi:hypothetical protein
MSSARRVEVGGVGLSRIKNRKCLIFFGKKLNPKKFCGDRLEIGGVGVIFLYRQKSKIESDYIFSDPSVLIISWLQTSVLALIGKVKVFKPSWNKLCQELSPKLWLPIEIDSLSSSRASFHAVRSNSWFSMLKSSNLQTIPIKKKNKILKGFIFSILNFENTSFLLFFFTPIHSFSAFLLFFIKPVSQLR